jgi:competence protein ComGC
MTQSIYSSNRGFSLVEALVAGTISLLVLATLFTIFQMNMAQVSHGATNSKVQMQYQIVINEIERNVRKASRLNNSRTFPTINNTTVCRTNVMYMFDIEGNWTIGYKTGDVSFKQFDPPNTTSYSVIIGGDTVKIINTDSLFIIDPSMKKVTVNLLIISSSGSVSDTAYPKRETFSCRN